MCASLASRFDNRITNDSTRFLESLLEISLNHLVSGEPRWYKRLQVQRLAVVRCSTVLHRSGNVHDYKGSVEFVTSCVMTVRERLPSGDWRCAWRALFLTQTSRRPDQATVVTGGGIGGEEGLVRKSLEW